MNDRNMQEEQAIKELSEEDKEQLEYINKWWEEKREKQILKMQKKYIKKMHLNFAKTHFKLAIKELIYYFNL